MGELCIRINRRFNLGVGWVTCMAGVPHPWWNVSRTYRYNVEGLAGNAVTVSIWRLRVGYWKAGDYAP